MFYKLSKRAYVQNLFREVGDCSLRIVPRSPIASAKRYFSVNKTFYGNVTR